MAQNQNQTTNVVELSSLWLRVRFIYTQLPGLMRSRIEGIFVQLVILSIIMLLIEAFAVVIRKLFLPDIEYYKYSIYLVAITYLWFLIFSPYFAINYLCDKRKFNNHLPSIASMMGDLRRNGFSGINRQTAWSVFLARFGQNILFVATMLATAGVAVSSDGLASRGLARFVPLVLVYAYANLKRKMFDNRLGKSSPRCLYLRAFSMDLVGKYIWLTKGAAPSWWKVIDRFSGGRKYASSLTSGVEFRFSSILEEIVGPVVAVGRPGESIPIPGVHRLYFDDANWQVNVSALLLQCELVVVAVGSTPGVQWEIEQIRLNDYFNKVIWLFLPERDAESRQARLRLLATIFPAMYPLLENARDFGTEIACAFVSRSGILTQVNIGRGDRFSYREAMIVALFEKRTMSKRQAQTERVSV